MNFEGQHKLVARAVCLSQGLELKQFEQHAKLGSNPLVVTVGSHGAAVLFRYGVVVMFGLSHVEEVAFLKEMETYASDVIPSPESESAQLCLTQQHEDYPHAIPLDTFNVQRLQVVASVLAKSVVLAHYEAEVAQTFDGIEPLAINLQKRENLSHNGGELLAHIGDVLMIQGRMIGRVEVREKPELLWEEPEYERLHKRMVEEYELIERHRALERKLELISRTAETLLGLLQNKLSHRVEWYIVGLIVIEVFLTLYEMWGKHLIG